MTCRVVCISHATGAGGEEVGRLVAERLGFLYVDEEIVAGAAATGGINPDDVADEERRSRSLPACSMRWFTAAASYASAFRLESVRS